MRAPWRRLNTFVLGHFIFSSGICSRGGSTYLDRVSQSCQIISGSAQNHALGMKSCHEMRSIDQGMGSEYAAPDPKWGVDGGVVPDTRPLQQPPSVQSVIRKPIIGLWRPMPCGAGTSISSRRQVPNWARMVRETCENLSFSYYILRDAKGPDLIFCGLIVSIKS